jgi:tryptophan-rich sensory protein
MVRARDVVGLAVAVLVVLGVAGAGAAVTAPAVGSWYLALNRPSWTPPSWLFGPVWTALYLMMAIAAWLVWRRLGWREGALPLGLFALQLVLNAAWTPVFFGLHVIGWAFGVIVLLWCAILATLIAFWRVLPAAGWLLLPYQLWVTFATALNFALWRLNA